MSSLTDLMLQFCLRQTITFAYMFKVCHEQVDDLQHASFTDIPECDTETCSDGGTCKERVGGGTVCLGLCASHQCFNGATCTDLGMLSLAPVSVAGLVIIVKTVRLKAFMCHLW